MTVSLSLARFAVAETPTTPSKATTDSAVEVALRIEGLEDGPLLRNVRNTAPPNRLGCNAQRVRVLSYLRNVEVSAQTALRALGHFNAEVETRIDSDAGCLHPVVSITAGPPVLIESVDIVIDGPFESDPSARRFFENLNLKVGDTLNQGRYDSARDDLINRARARGFLDARYTRRTLWVDPDENTARVELTLASGPRYRFGDISAPQDILYPRFVRRLIPVKPGDDYSSDSLAAISSHLAASGYFADVRVRPDLDRREDETVPVNVLLTPRKRTAYEFRAGFGTDTGPRVRADIDRRWVNRRGHTWRGGLGLSQRISTLDTVYSVPHRNPLTDRLDFFARTSREDNNDILSDTAAVGMQVVRVRGGWTQSAFTEFRYERTEFGDEDPDSNNFLLVGARLGHRVLDDPLFPTRGHSLNVMLQGAAESLLSSTSLMQGVVNATLLRPAGKYILKVRGDFGTTWVDDFDALPKSLRFFTGGDTTVRGYDFETLGPENDDGQVVGGRHLLVLSAEAMMPIYGSDWYGAAFVDTGNAFDSFAEMDLQTGAGIGARWRSPIGMVRIDVAFPLSDGSSSPRLHLGIGAEF
ncbi:autotransporter assembly complex protein TamA [Rhodocyclaceae bacterium SMB388]